MTAYLTSWTLAIPYASPPLRDNDRMHWGQKAAITRDLRDMACLLAHREKLPRNLDRARIVLHWRPAVVRTRDQLGIAPTLKPLVDGLIDYGLLPDDNSLYAEVSCRIEPVEAPALLWLTITDLSDREETRG